MALRESSRADLFLVAASPLLLADEARHNLIFGICATLDETPDAYPSARLWTVEEDGDTLAAALMTPPFNLVVAQPRTGAALSFLAEELHRRGVELPGVTGAVPEVEQFASDWEELTGVRRRARMRQGIYAARAARQPEGVPGCMRTALREDRRFLLDWWRAFEAESLPHDAPHVDTEANVDRRLASDANGIMLWEDGDPVSLAAFGGRTPHGVRIGPVYTPPEFRRRGYASALVAQLTQDLLDGGRDLCFLYTDLANPGANRLYRDIGYELVADSVDYAF